MSRANLKKSESASRMGVSLMNSMLVISFSWHAIDDLRNRRIVSFAR